MSGHDRDVRMGQLTLIRRAVLLGVNGLVGQLLARKLVESGASVSGLDLQEEAFDRDLGIDYTQCDATAHTAEGLKAIGSADTVFVCLPEDAALEALPEVVKGAAQDSLIIDTLSVKKGLVAALEPLRPTQEYVSINPMFSPKIGFAGQGVALVTVNAGPRGAEFESLLTSWGARGVHVGADEHDRITALMQVVTHAALMSIGLVMHEWGYDLEKAVGMATPPHRICLALLARMADASPEVYWDIQRSNAFAADARRCLLDKLSDLSEIVAGDQEESFRDVMARIGSVLDPLRNELLDCAASISAASGL